MSSSERAQSQAVELLAKTPLPGAPPPTCPKNTVVTHWCFLCLTCGSANELLECSSDTSTSECAICFITISDSEIMSDPTKRRATKPTGLIPRKSGSAREQIWKYQMEVPVIVIIETAYKGQCTPIKKFLNKKTLCGTKVACRKRNRKKFFECS